jgi:hypothetical protein
MNAARRRATGPLVLLATLLLLVAADHAPLAWLGRPLWEYDPVLLYRMRPNVDTTWGKGYGNRPLRTNRFGLADDDFPERKPPGERRILVIGDSIVMGHGLAHRPAGARTADRPRLDACAAIVTGVRKRHMRLA